MTELQKTGYKDAFYAQLRKEYTNKIKESFIWRYMKAEKENSFHLLLERKEKGLENRKADQGVRKDSYVQMKERFYDLQAGTIEQKDYLITVLRILTENSKLHLESRQSDKEQPTEPGEAALKKLSRDILLEYGEKIGGEDIYHGVRGIQKKYKRIIKIMESETHMQKLEKEDLEQIHEEVLDCLLKLDVQTFMYDVGYPLNDKDSPVYKSRKKDKTMDMLSAYCEEQGIYFGKSQSASNGQFTETQKVYCKKKFKELNKEDKYSAVVLPIQIDSLTGCGIYIMGKDYFPDFIGNSEKYKGNCYYACFYWNDIQKGDWMLEGKVIRKDTGVEFRWDDSSEEEDWRGSYFTKLSNALDQYYTQTRNDAEDFFAERNEGIWEEYRKVMLGDEADKKTVDLDVTKEEIEAITEVEMRKEKQIKELRIKNKHVLD